MMHDAFLQVRDLHIHTGDKGGGRTLVQGVGFTCARGKVFGLIGESGSGKSLTCLSLLGLLPAGLSASASIRLNGEDIGGALSGSGSRPGRRIRNHLRKNIRGKSAAMILQNPMSCFDPVFTIARHFQETLAAHGKAHGTWRKKACSALLEVGFPDPEAALPLFPFQMSGGMLQRVMIAIALALDSPFLIADEPTTDLDVVAQAKVLDLLQHLKYSHGLGILLVTHDLSVIARLADDVAVMQAGRIIETGSVCEIFEQPKAAYTKALLSAHHALYGTDDVRQACPAFGKSMGSSGGPV